MYIQTEETPDPASLKFRPDREVLNHGILEFNRGENASKSPLAVKLFGIPDISTVTLGPNYIMVTKTEGEWDVLKPAVLNIIMTHYMSGASLVNGHPDEASEQTEKDGIAKEIETALRQVIDPELGYNIVDLGLIYDVSVDDHGAALVIMTTTTPGCPATDYLCDGAYECATSVQGVKTAEVELSYDPLWSPDKMSDEAKAYLGIQ